MTASPALSLLERAAQVYDFAAARRTSTPLPSEPAPRPAPPAAAAQPVDRARLAAAGFILPYAAPDALSEEFRLVKRQLLIAAGSARNRMILVCSAQPGEGKTFCAVNLALSMASERDWEVLLVDADTAKPGVMTSLGLPAGPGLIDALADLHADAERLVVRTDLGRLSVLPAGRRVNDATELLASDRTRAVLERLTARPQRILIFDSPPALAASIASELAHHVGQALLVVRADRTSEAELRDAIGLLGGCERLQLLLNGVQFAPSGRRFGSYYGDDD